MKLKLKKNILTSCSLASMEYSQYIIHHYIQNQRFQHSQKFHHFYDIWMRHFLYKFPPKYVWSLSNLIIII